MESRGRVGVSLRVFALVLCVALIFTLAVVGWLAL